MKNDLVAGINPVQMLLNKKPEIFVEVYISLKNERLKQIESQLNLSKIPKKIVDTKFLDSLTNQKHQGIIAKIVSSKFKKEKELDKYLQKEDSLILILDNITDPHNFGAILRSCDAFNIDLIIVTNDNSAPLNEITRRTSAGAADMVDIISVVNLARTMDKLKENDFWIVGTAGETQKLITEHDFKGKTAIVMGAEGTGIRYLVKKMCDFLIKIPMHGVVDSLNVSVATGIVLFEATKNRNNK